MIDLLNKKLELITKFKESEVEIEKSIQNEDFEYLQKRSEQNNFYIRQIDEIDLKLKDIDLSAFAKINNEINNNLNELKNLHKINLSGINNLMKNFKGKALKANQTTKPLKAYVSNLKKDNYL